MATTYRTPGVYIEEISKFPPSIAEVETAIPAFIGYTQKAVKGGIDYLDLLKKSADAAAAAAQKNTEAIKAEADAKANPGDQAKQDAAKAARKGADDAQAAADAAKFSPVPIRITSLLEYEKFFGKTMNAKGIRVKVTSEEITAEIDQLPTHNMYYSLQAYFANGGGPCYIVPVGGISHFVPKKGDDGKEVLVEEETPVEAADLIGGLDAIAKEDEVTLIVFPESLSLITVENLSKDPAGAYGKFKGLHDAALKQCNDLQDRFVVMDALLDPATLDKTIKDFSVFDAAEAFRSFGTGTDNSKYGAAYGPHLETIFTYLYDEKDVEVTIYRAYRNSKGDLVSPTDSTGKPAELQLPTDPYFSEPADPQHPDGPKKNQPTKSDLDSLGPNSRPTKEGEIFPLAKSAIDRLPVILPTSPIVAGIYASVDNDRGVWKAPANVSLLSVIKPTIKITKEDQDNLNVHTTGKSINAIRAFTGKGTLVWGARTLAGNNNEWRYISVRRFFIMVEESVKKGTESFVFEPNDANTWTKVRAMIENFLTLQWRAGALQGAKPEQAFYVRVGLPETMTALDILEGRMIIEIGMAVVRPAEFIILKFSHKMVES
jgi:phage tail sheath protein FI